MRVLHGKDSLCVSHVNEKEKEQASGCHELRGKGTFPKMGWYIFSESDEQIHHGNPSALPVMQNMLFAFRFPANAKINIYVLENTRKVMHSLDGRKRMRIILTRIEI